MEAIQNRRYTAEEYLELEQSTGKKLNFYDGEVFAMAGGTTEHGLLCSKIAALLDREVSGKGKCIALNSEMKIWLQRYNAYVYPDASVVCGPLEQPERPIGAIGNPKVIVEVFSESSEGEDRGTKFRKYRSLPSLENYVLIAQDRPLVEVWYRAPGQDLWRIDTYEGYEATFTLQAIDCELSIGEVYATVRGMLSDSAASETQE